jgi:cytoskeletal protein CcmA (bactofilin family)
MEAKVQQRPLSRICRGIMVEGDLEGDEDLVIEGRVKGAIRTSGNVTVGAEGRVEARIQARSVVIHGEVTGDVAAGERLEIHASGRLKGDCSARSIQIEDGGIFEGRSQIVRGTPPAGAGSPPPGPTAS